ncbi:MAG: hypothetical protein KDA84_12700 [Planctomycetaceae bacterium]|nr:hypothetical protein [Planctomycetaceae bacterium]
MSAAKRELEPETRSYIAVQNAYEPGDRLDSPNGVQVTSPSGLFWEIRIPIDANVPGVGISEGMPVSELDLVLDKVVNRRLAVGDMLFLQDLAPPDPPMMIDGSERALFITLDGVSFEPALLRVGSEIGFVVALNEDSLQVASPELPVREIGPFRILSIGGKVAVEARGESPIITVVSNVIGENGELDANSVSLLAAEDSRQLRALTLWPATRTASSE